MKINDGLAFLTLIIAAATSLALFASDNHIIYPKYNLDL